MSIPAKLKALLDTNRIRYTAITHSPAYTAQAAAAVMHVPGKELAKTVVLRAGEEETILAVLPASAHANLRDLSSVVGKPLRLATEKEFAGLFPDCELGPMPPLGELYNLPVYVDEGLASHVEIVFPAGTHHEAIRMRFEDFARLVRPVQCSFCRKAVASWAAGMAP
jgi:Ala-tRNA(Pro) deacylase